MRTMAVQIVTPDGPVLEMDGVELVSTKATSGDIGILPGHVPMVAPLAIGSVRIRKGDEVELLAISGGFIEVRPDKVTILAETAERAEDIDLERAIRAKQRAEERLRQQHQSNIDFKRAELALRRAMNRIKVAQQK
jgi:ATP synthase F1 subcomplex epsilon subunit